MARCRIVSRGETPFRDRVEAGQVLGRELSELRGQGALVLGVPRGGVVVAREIAGALDAELDIVLARKLGAPGNPEVAIGAVTEDGQVFLSEARFPWLARASAYVESEKERQLAEIARRAALYRRVRPKVPLAGRLVIVTDDGVATGATLQAALWAARQEGPSRLVAALPVGPEDTVARLAEEADEMVCLRTPPQFYAVGQFYETFEQTEDEELIEILAAEAERTAVP
jgi:predicted phosphoribosyltransferase